MMQLAHEGVITIGKGDILGLIFMAPVLCVAVGLIGAWLMYVGMNGVQGSAFAFFPVALGLCALVGWGMWDFGHWLTA